MLKTELCDLLGIDYPILQGGMVWVSYAGLCASVSEAGGLGVLAGGSMTPEELSGEIDAVKSKTNKPFGVNIPLVKEDAADLIRVAIEGAAPVLCTSAGNPNTYTPKIQEAGAKVIHVSPSAGLAEKAAEAGVDAVVAEGIEAGGHNGYDEITTMALVPQVVDRLDTPVIAAGGIADGRGFVAALALGATGIQMGTRFAATHEAMGHPKFKEAILKAHDGGTVITGRSIGPTRCVRNRLAELILEAEKRGTSPEDLLNLIGRGRARQATIDGDVENGTIYCGQIAGLVNDLKSVKEVMQEVVADAEQRVKALAESFDVPLSGIKAGHPGIQS